MAAKRKPDPYETGDAKMKMAALKYVKAVRKEEAVETVPSPAKALQDQLEAHYEPWYKRLSVTLVSLLFVIAFVGGWVSASGGVASI